jgi:hypothetical protein
VREPTRPDRRLLVVLLRLRLRLLLVLLVVLLGRRRLGEWPGLGLEALLRGVTLRRLLLLRRALLLCGRLARTRRILRVVVCVCVVT